MATVPPPVQFRAKSQASSTDLDNDITNAGTGGAWMYGGTAAGAPNALTITVPNDITSYLDGQVFRFIAASNNTATATLTVTPLGSGPLGTLPLCDQDGGALGSGQLVAGRMYEFYVTTIAGVTKLRWPQVTTGGTTPFTTGDIKLTWKVTADTGWIIATDGTIGSVASGATTRANADTQDLFTLIWTNIGAAGAPIFDSTGAPTTYGASAAADFASNKRLQTGTIASRALASAGQGSGLTLRTLGTVVGEEAHALTANENGTHAHAMFNDVAVSTNTPIIAGQPAAAIRNAGAVSGDYTIQPSNIGLGANVGITANSGLGTAHNTMQPTTFMNVMVKL